MGLIADDRINRIAVPQIFLRIARFIKSDDFENILGFLITQACLDQNSEVAKAAQKAAREIVLVQGNQYSN